MQLVEKRKLIINFVHGLGSWESLNQIPNIDIAFNELGYLEFKSGPEEFEITIYDLFKGIRSHLSDFEELRKWASIIVCGLVDINFQSLNEKDSDDILECLHDLAFGEATKDRVNILIKKYENMKNKP